MTRKMYPPSVLGIIFSTDRRSVLILKRRDVDMWVFPGGGVDSGEMPEAAMLREIKEETGIEARIVRKIGEYTPINRLSRLTYLFECEPLTENLQIGSETKELGFYPINELPKEFFHIHEAWLKDALLNKSEIIYAEISNVTYGKLVLYFMRHPLRVLRFLMSRLGCPINKN